jgi:hypothetical protein
MKWDNQRSEHIVDILIVKLKVLSEEAMDTEERRNANGEER